MKIPSKPPKLPATSALKPTVKEKREPARVYKGIVFKDKGRIYGKRILKSKPWIFFQTLGRKTTGDGR